MKRLLPIFLAASLFSAVAAAADLTLTDGRTFAEYRVVSQTAARVTIRHQGGMSVVEKSLLPPELLAAYPIDKEAAVAEAAKIDEGKRLYEEQRAAVAAERAASSAARDERVAEKAARQAAESRATARTPKTPELLPGEDATAYRQRTNAEYARLMGEREIRRLKGQIAAEERRDAASSFESIEAALRRHAERHFETSKRAGSGRTLVFEVKTDIAEIKPVVGWPAHADATGTSWFQYYDSVWGGSFSSYQATWRARVDSSSGRTKVVSFDVR